MNININPKLQKQLHGLHSNLNTLIQLYEKNNLSNKILLSGPKGIGKSTLAYHFINYIFSKDEKCSYNLNDFIINEQNRSFKLIENQSHPNIFTIDLLDDKKSIDVSQVREMISYANKSSFNNKPRLVLIDNVENLNTNSLNALLKIVEEPNENLFFILIHDSRKKILDTLKSRCIVFKLNLTYDKSLDVTNKILGINIFEYLNEDLINYYSSPGELVNIINFSINNNIDLKKISLKEFLLLLINQNYYSKDKFIKLYIFNIIQNYFLYLLNKTNTKDNIYMLHNRFIKMNYNCIKYNLNYENLFIEFKTKILNE